MTSKEVFKLLTLGTKFNLHRKCIKAGFGAKKGYSYTQKCTVYRAARFVKRIWENPPRYKAATIEVVIEPSVGYFDITSTYLDDNNIEKTDSGFMIIGKPNLVFDLPVWSEVYTIKDIGG